MALNQKHIRVHAGKQEYTGEESGNIVLGQGGVDILVAQNDLCTAGGVITIAGVVAAKGGAEVKGWTAVTALGSNAGDAVTCTVQVKVGSVAYTSINLQMPIGVTIYGPFYYIKLTDTVSHGEALYCLRG